MIESVINQLPVLLDMMKRAGDKILEIYYSPDFEIQSKSDNSPLTRADKESNDIICDSLQQHFPEIPIVSEENKEIDYATRKGFEYCWCVDPLDGTKEFIKRNGDFTVNVALIHKGTAIAGFVYMPVDELMYYGIQGIGAYKIKGNEREVLNVLSYKENDPGLRIVCSRSHLNDETRSFVENYLEPELVSRGSSLKFILIAEGKAEIYPRIAPTMEWDTAAAQVVLEQAGGEVVTFESGERLSYNKESLLNPYFIARANKIS